jgi:hypothetical protein
VERAAEYSVFAKGRSKRYQIIYHPFEFVFTHAINFYSNYHANFHLDYLGRRQERRLGICPWPQVWVRQNTVKVKISCSYLFSIAKKDQSIRLPYRKKNLIYAEPPEALWVSASIP